jgi:hypothetical protein
VEERPDAAGSLERADVEAALHVRRELGTDYEPALVDAFAERIERAVEARVDARLAEARAGRKHDGDMDSKQLALGITSLALGIPLSAIAAGTADTAGLLAAWAGIVGVNWAYAWQHRTSRGDRRR